MLRCYLWMPRYYLEKQDNKHLHLDNTISCNYLTSVPYLFRLKKYLIDIVILGNMVFMFYVSHFAITPIPIYNSTHAPLYNLTRRICVVVRI